MNEQLFQVSHVIGGSVHHPNMFYPTSEHLVKSILTGYAAIIEKKIFIKGEHVHPDIKYLLDSGGFEILTGKLQILDVEEYVKDWTNLARIQKVDIGFGLDRPAKDVGDSEFEKKLAWTINSTKLQEKYRSYDYLLQHTVHGYTVANKLHWWKEHVKQIGEADGYCISSKNASFKTFAEQRKLILTVIAFVVESGIKVPIHVLMGTSNLEMFSYIYFVNQYYGRPMTVDSSVATRALGFGRYLSLFGNGYSVTDNQDLSKNDEPELTTFPCLCPFCKSLLDQEIYPPFKIITTLVRPLLICHNMWVMDKQVEMASNCARNKDLLADYASLFMPRGEAMNMFNSIDDVVSKGAEAVDGGQQLLF